MSLDKFIYDKYFLFSLNLSKFWEFDSNPSFERNGFSIRHIVEYK